MRARARSLGHHRCCENLTQKSIGTIGRGCPDLEELYLAHVACTDITEIARGCRKLKSLDVHRALVPAEGGGGGVRRARRDGGVRAGDGWGGVT